MKKLWVFGDSTSCENTANPSGYAQGWPYYLREVLTDGIECKNVAAAGTTLRWNYYCEAYRKGEINENIPEDSRWYKIVSEVEKGDLFIFFIGGINDHGQIADNTYYPCQGGGYILDDFQKHFKNKDVYMYVGKGYGTHRFYTATSTVERFAEILTDMIEQVKAKGGLPMLARGTGKYYMQNDDNFDAFPASRRYMEVLPAVAEKVNVPYFDVGGIFDKGFKEIGYKAMMENYFLTKAAVKRLNLKYGRSNGCDYDDNCHHNLNGAKHICDILVDEVKKSDYPLKDYLK